MTVWGILQYEFKLRSKQHLKEKGLEFTGNYIWTTTVHACDLKY